MKSYRNFKNFLILTTTCASIFTIFFGLTSTIQELGFKDSSTSGIVFGATQTFSYLLISFKLPKMTRKKFLLIFQFLTILTVSVLFYTSNLQKTEKRDFFDAILSAGFLGFFNAGCFPLFFSLVSEIFPTKIRGIANAYITFFGRFFASFAPYLSSYAQKNGYHVMCGCGVITFLSFFLCFFLSGDEKMRV